MMSNKEPVKPEEPPRHGEGQAQPELSPDEQAVFNKITKNNPPPEEGSAAAQLLKSAVKAAAAVYIENPPGSGRFSQRLTYTPPSTAHLRGVEDEGRRPGFKEPQGDYVPTKKRPIQEILSGLGEKEQQIINGLTSYFPESEFTFSANEYGELAIRGEINESRVQGFADIKSLVEELSYQEGDEYEGVEENRRKIENIIKAMGKIYDFAPEERSNIECECRESPNRGSKIIICRIF